MKFYIISWKSGPVEACTARREQDQDLTPEEPRKWGEQCKMQILLDEQKNCQRGFLQDLKRSSASPKMPNKKIKKIKNGQIHPVVFKFQYPKMHNNVFCDDFVPNQKLISDKIFLFSCVSIETLSFKVHRSSTSVDFNGAYNFDFAWTWTLTLWLDHDWSV